MRKVCVWKKGGKGRKPHHSRAPTPFGGVRGASRITLRQKRNLSEKNPGVGREECAFTKLQVTITAWGQGKRDRSLG